MEKAIHVGGEYAEENRAVYGSGTWFYYNDRFDKSVSLLPCNLTDLKILDIGCGSGVYSRFCSKKGASVFSLDLSKDCLAETKELLKRSNTDAHLVNADACFLPFKDESFDYMLALEVIEHIPNYPQVLKEIKRTLGQKGILLLSFPSKWSIREVGVRLVAYFTKRVRSGHFHFFSLKSMYGILEENRLKMYKENFACYLFPFLKPFLGKSTLVNHLFLVLEDIISKTPLKNLAWTVIVLCSNEEG